MQLLKSNPAGLYQESEKNLKLVFLSLSIDLVAFNPEVLVLLWRSAAKRHVAEISTFLVGLKLGKRKIARHFRVGTASDVFVLKKYESITLFIDIAHHTITYGQF